MRRIFLLISAFLTALFSSAGTQVKIQPSPTRILPIEITHTENSIPKNVSGGYYYDLLDRQINLDKQTVYLHTIRHIVNESGVQDASEVSVYFSPQFQQVVFHTVAVIRNGQSVSQLNASSIKTSDEESDAPSYLYNGNRRAYIILKNIQKGDLIDISYSVIGFNPVFNGLYAGEGNFSYNTEISNLYLTYIADKNRKLNFKLYNGAVAPSEQTVGSQIIYQWKNPVVETYTDKYDVPSWYSTARYVTVTEYKDWKQVNDWALNVFNNYQYKLPEKLKQKISEWKRMSAGDIDMFTNLALRYVQDQIRYLGLEIGTNTHQPHAPEMVFDQGFGDCKDKALLLTVILKSENIEAWIALANTFEKSQLAAAAPSAIAFNHAIVALKRGKEFVFVDPTIALQRGELINNYIPAYGYALVVQPGGYNLTPVEPGFLNYRSIMEDLQVSLQDVSFLRVTSERKGGSADDMRGQLSGASMKELKENYLNYYNKLFEGIEMDSTIAIEDDSLNNKITVSESYKIPKIWQKNKDGKIEVNTYAKLMALMFPDPANHKGNDPVALEFPYTMDYTLRMTMPDDWPIEMEPVHIKNESYQFDFTPSSNGKHLLFKYFFKSFRDHIPGEEFAQYKSDFKDINGSFSLAFTTGDILSQPANQKSFKPEGNTNWITVWTCLLSCVLLTMLFNFLNRRSRMDNDFDRQSSPIRGAVIVLAITLGIRILYQSFVFFEQHYFHRTVWTTLGSAGGGTLQMVLVVEMCISLFAIAGPVALLYWFFHKRDIFPFMFIRFVVVCLIAQAVLILLYYNLHANIDLTQVKSDAVAQFTRAVVYAAVWIGFIVKSENVKQIFVRPYNSMETV